MSRSAPGDTMLNFGSKTLMPYTHIASSKRKVKVNLQRILPALRHVDAKNS